MTDVTTAEIVNDDESVEEAATVSGALDVRSAVTSLNDPTSGMYSTITAKTFAEKMALAKAINASTPLDEVLNETFNLANYIVQVVEINDNATGESILAPRVTLIDDAGKAYHGTSKGLLTALKNLNATVGDPSQWEGQTIPVKVVEEKGAKWKYFTIKFV